MRIKLQMLGQRSSIPLVKETKHGERHCLESRLMNYTSLSLFAALAMAAAPGHAEVYLGIGYGAPAPYVVAPSPSYYYAAPPVQYGPPAVQYVPRPVYAPRPVIVAPPPEAVPGWRWQEDDRRWNRWQRHHHRGWREDDDED